MILLPVVWRELLVASRLRRTYAQRQIAVVLGLGTAGFFFLVTRQFIAQNRMGRELFEAISVVLMFTGGLLALVSCADAFSREKREGTLGLLFLTDLRSIDIVLGKLAGRGVDVFYACLAALPVLTMPVLLGGITAPRIVQTIVAILGILAITSAVSLFVSAISMNIRKAMVGILILGGLIFFGPLMLCEALEDGYTRGGFEWVTYPSPLYAAAAALNSGSWSQPFWISSGFTFAMSLVLVWLTCRILPRVWQEKAASVRTERWNKLKVRLTLGPKRLRSSRKRRLLDRNPVVWIEDRYRFRKTVVWLALLSGLALWINEVAPRPQSMFRDDDVIGIWVWTYFIALPWIAFYAPQRLNEDRQSGALELLLVTPVTVRQMIRGHLIALRRQFGWPILVIVLAEALLMIAVWNINSKNVSWWNRERELMWLSLGTAGIVRFLLDTYTLAWVGMWQGLVRKGALRASVIALARVVVLPWVLFLGCLAFIVSSPGTLRANAEWWLLAAWFGLGLISSLVNLIWARRQLHNHLRTIVAGGIPERNWIKKFFSRRRSSPSTSPARLAAS